MGDSFDRRAFLKGIAASGVGITLAGCGGDSGATTQSGDGGSGGDNETSDGGDGTSAETETTTESGSDSLNVGMIYSTGGLGDNSFNDMAHKGIQAAEEEFGVSYKNAEPEQPSEFSSFQRQFAQSGEYDLIFCIGFSQKSALQESASQFSDQKFTIVDEVVGESNVESYVFKEHEGSFQAGVMAGLLTDQSFSAGAGETNPDESVIGFVGGKETPLIKKFEAGYRFGAQQVNPDVTVKRAYSGSWSDPGSGQSIANSMYNDGADVVYHAAGGTGVGVIQAAKEQGRFAIGVDARQSETLPDYANVILGSMVKQVDQAVLESVRHVVDDEFAGGETITLGLAEEGARLMYGTEIGDSIPQDVKDEVQAQSEQVTNGDLTVPSSVSDL